MNASQLRAYLPELKQIWDALLRRDDIPNRADAIVVGGSWDVGLAERVAELFHAGISNFIVISGYRPEYLEVSEAELLAGRCIELGVPSDVITLEKEASNTGENIIFSAKLVNGHIPSAQNVILVHKPFMSLRFLATAEAQWPAPQPQFYTTCQNISFEEYTKMNDFKAVCWEMLGDIKRMDEYVARGFQTPQPVPQSARDAYEKIVSAGFTTR